jgi:hypothetical protein
VGTFVWLDCRAYQGGADLTGQSNKIQAKAMADQKPATTFSSNGWVERKGTVRSAQVAHLGFWDAGTGGLPDDRAFADLGASVPYTACPTAGLAAADLCYLTRFVQTEYEAFGQYGDLVPYSIKGVSDVPLVRGQILHPGGTARTATGSGTAVQVGAVATGQRMWAALHVISIAGTSTPTLTVRLQSASSGGFGSPTTQATFTAATAIGGQFTSVAGPVTDTWWRADWTISGSTPSFLFVLSAGVSAP